MSHSGFFQKYLFLIFKDQGRDSHTLDLDRGANGIQQQYCTMDHNKLEKIKQMMKSEQNLEAFLSDPDFNVDIITNGDQEGQDHLIQEVKKKSVTIKFKCFEDFDGNNYLPEKLPKTTANFGSPAPLALDTDSNYTGGSFTTESSFTNLPSTSSNWQNQIMDSKTIFMGRRDRKIPLHIIHNEEGEFCDYDTKLVMKLIGHSPIRRRKEKKNLVIQNPKIFRSPYSNVCSGVGGGRIIRVQFLINTKF
jgi:hypothetical protein